MRPGKWEIGMDSDVKKLFVRLISKENNEDKLVTTSLSAQENKI